MIIPANFSQLYNVIDDSDADKFVNFLTDDAAFRFGNAPEVTGKKDIRDALNGFFKSIKGLKHTIHEFWSHPETIICEGECTYTRHDDSQVTIPFVNIFKMEGDLIKDYLIYIDISPLYATDD